MRFMVCGYGLPEEWPYLPRMESLGVGIELQSYGLRGVASIEQWREKLDHHREVVKRFRGNLAVHGPFLGITYDFEDHLLREAVRNRMDMTYKMVLDLRPQTLVMHTGYTEEVSRFHSENKWLLHTGDFWHDEIRRYEREDVLVVLENLLEPGPETMIDLIDRVGSDHLKLCFDIGHANIWSGLTPSQWVERMGARLGHVHLHDNNGVTDEHLPAGAGKIDFDSFFDALYRFVPDVTVSLEVDADKEVVVANLMEVLEKYGR
ncbi:sugar phosphate isomerase/epimerase [bacterium]|nr:sugar phosphate isomerase/epimerase [candidate division CSSED10-310 bacterium]